MSWKPLEFFPWKGKTYFLVVVFEFKLLLFNSFELISEVELSCFLLQLSKFIFVFGDFLKGRLDTVDEVQILDNFILGTFNSTYNLPLRSLT